MLTANDRLRTRLLAVIAFVIGIAALRASYPVTMPLAVALIVIAAVWPVKAWLDARLPPWLSYTATVLCLVLTLLLFAAAVYYSGAEVARALASKWPRLEQAYAGLVDWARGQGITLSQTGARRTAALIQTIVADAYTFLIYLGFVGVLVILGLPEMPRAYAKLKAELPQPAWCELLDTAQVVADKIRKYLGVTFATSCLTGIASALWAYLNGLELALTWGVLNFLLNFVPVVGNIIGIVPPTLYAVVQWEDPIRALIVFAGFAALQLTISNFIYPLLQGRSLSLSPVVIVLSLAFWSWIWGVAGALIAVPLTAAVAIICEHFDRTRWIAKIIAKD
jgi:predicted PurR-regulated permease PerM